MDSKFQLSETEKQIVEFLWGHGGEAETKDIYSHFKEQKEEWARQTLNTLLLRVEEKGIIERPQRGMVKARYSRAEYDSLCCREFIETRFSGNIANAIRCYYNGPIPEYEAQELIDCINSMR